MIITFARAYEQLNIYIDGSLHLHIRLQTFIGMQSWSDGEKEYFIGFYFKDTSITTTYEERELWLSVLGQLNEALK